MSDRKYCQRVPHFDHEHPFQHPAVSAALSARNAISAEMAVAGRAGHDPFDRFWLEAQGAPHSVGHTAWILASDAYAQMREDLAGFDPAEYTGTDGAMGAATAVTESFGKHATALAALATPVAGAAATASRSIRSVPTVAIEAIHRPAARRRRERLQTAGWFVIGGIGGLLLASTVHLIEMVLAWH